RFEQSGLGYSGIGARAAKPKRPRPSWNKIRACFGIAACEQRHIVAELDQLFDEPRDDTLSPPIELGGNTFGEWSNLGDPHLHSHLSARVGSSREDPAVIDC